MWEGIFQVQHRPLAIEILRNGSSLDLGVLLKALRKRDVKRQP
jgi:hypothetical protein